MYRNLFFIMALGCCFTSSLWAQKGAAANNLVRHIFQGGLRKNVIAPVNVSRASALSRVGIASAELGREAFRLHPSAIGTKDYSLRAARFNTVNKLIPSQTVLAKLVQKHWIAEPVDGYIVSPSQLKDLDMPAEAESFKIVYGKDKKFKGMFVSSFEDVRLLLYMPVQDGTDALSALNAAYREAVVKHSGFFVVSIGGNAYRPKDVLVWNAAGKYWISMNKSKAAVLRNDRLQMRDFFNELHSFWKVALETRGAIVRPDNYEYPSLVRVSTDGLNWHQFDINTSAGADLWDAWKEAFYIVYDRHLHSARFAAAKGEPLFSSPRRVRQWNISRQAGIEMTETLDGRAVFKLDAESCPNLWMRRADGSLEAIPGIALTENEAFSFNVIRFMKEVQEISARELAKNPSVKLIFLKEKAQSGVFSARECVERVPTEK